jgi:hypothetical protein
MLVDCLFGKENVMTLTMRKAIVLGLIGSILLLGNIMLVANWLSERGVVDWARGIRAEYLTGTAVTIIVVLLILLVSPRVGARGLVRRCPVCDHVLVSRGKYCGECGSKL